jgi:tetratricopeptide (TPR) repeat protein
MLSYRYLVFLSVALSVCGHAFANDDNPATLIDHGHYKQARAVLEKKFSINSKDAETLVFLARVRIAYGNFDDAIKLLEQAISLQPKRADAHIYLAEAYSHKTNDAGMFEKVRIGRTIQSETEQALAIDPKNIDALEGMVEFYLEAPGILGGSRSKAEETAEKIIALDPARGNLAKAEIARHEKERDKAESFYNKAVQASPSSYDALVALGSFYLREGSQNYDKAADYGQKAVQADSHRSGAYVILAQAYVSRGRFTDLDQLLKKSEQDLPDDLVPEYIAGRTLLTTGADNARAERYFRKYLTQTEEEGGTPALSSAHWRLAQVLEKENKKQEAIEELQTAVRLKSDFKEAQKDLKRLKS